MKKLIFLLSLTAVVFSGNAFAQGGPNIGGDFKFGTAPSFFTKLDTVTNTGVDTFRTPLNPYRNSVGFQVNVLKISGDPGDVVVTIWGSKAATTAGGYVQLATFNIGDDAGIQVFDYNVNNGVGNPYRWYMVTITGSGTQVCSWIAYCFIR